MKAIREIVIIGTGNVAWHLCDAFKSTSKVHIEIVGRNQIVLDLFKLEFEITVSSITSAIRTDADLYILALPDDVIAIVAENLDAQINGLVVHTSGTADMQVLSRFKNIGVLYPLQTMRKGESLDFSQVPMLIESNTDKGFKNLLEFAKTISQEVDQVNSAQRQKLHLAAVFTNNFTNHMVSLAREICERENVSFSYLQPLLKETFSKIKFADSRTVQTGPAIRYDESTIKKHMEFMANEKDKQLLYQLITQSIQKMHKNKDTFEE